MIVTQRKKATKEKKSPKASIWKGPSIMVIEDNPDHWLLIKKAIQITISEAEPVLAINEGQALDYLDSCGSDNWNMPKLILLDLYFPKRDDGWHLLECMKQMRSPINRLPVIVLSNSIDVEDINGAYRRGAASYIVKPINFADWLEYLQYIKTYWEEAIPLSERSAYFRNKS